MTEVVENVEITNGIVLGFRSERLVARRMQADDADYLARLHTDPRVMATVGGVRDATESEAWLQTNLSHWSDHGFGQWMLDVDDVCIGRGGLRIIDNCVGEDLVEVGYVIAHDHWGRGYATEATRSFVEIAYRFYGLTELGAITLKGNDASTRVLEKNGFRFERWVDHPVGPHRFLRHRATAS